MKRTNTINQTLRVLSGLALALAVFAVVQPAAYGANGSWTNDAAGNWSDGTQWSSNPTVPGTTAGDVVGLNYNITAARTITIDSTSRTVGTLTIGDPAAAFFGYTLAASGGAGLTFNNSGSGAALVQAWTTSSDTISAPLTLADNLTIYSWPVTTTPTLTLSGIIGDSGAGKAITKLGSGTLTLSGANTYSGTTTINGGTLVADTTSNGTILNSASGLTFGSSGTFQLKGLSGQTRSQIVNGLTLNGGAAIIDANNVSGGLSTTIDLRGTGGTLTITRSAGATTDFKATTGTFGTTAIVNTHQVNDSTGILGAWATVNTGTDWAINNGSDVAAAYTGYNTLSGNTLASGVGVNYRVASNPTTPTGNITLATTGTIDVNTLRISDTAARTIDVRNGSTQGILRVGAVGGLLTSGGNHIIGVAGIGTVGTLTAGGADNTAGELIVNNASSLTINSLISDNGSGSVSLTKSGAGTLTITNGANSFTGPTVINAGTLAVTATSGALGQGTPTVTVQSGGTLNLNKGSLSMGGNLYLNGGTLSISFNGTKPTWTGSVTLNATNSIIQAQNS